jgi:hypothetical protein
MKSPPHYGFTAFPEILRLRFGSGTAAGSALAAWDESRRAILIQWKEAYPVKWAGKWLPMATHDQGQQPEAAAPWKKSIFLQHATDAPRRL